MSRFLCWSVVALLAVTLSPATRSAVSQVPDDPPAAGNQEAPVPVPAVPSAPLPPMPGVGPSDTPAALIPAPQAVSAPLSFSVVNSLDAAMHQKIEEALDAVAEVEFQETPLSEVVAFLQATYKIPIIIDKRALDDVGLGSDTPVTMSLRGISLRSLLELMLRELQLTYVVREQVLKITTVEEAEHESVMRLYSVADLALEPQQPLVVDAPPSRYRTLLGLIASIVAPDTWDEVGGSGSAAAFDPWGVVVVSQTRENHEALESLLVTVCKVQRSTASPRTLEADYAPVPVVPTAQSAARAKIEQSLDGIANLDFSEAPLQEVARYLTDAHGIPILLDRRALDDVGLGGDTPVTISLQGVSLRHALRIVLRELDLTYVVKREVLMITTPEEGERDTPTLIYPVQDFLASPPQAGATTGGGSGLADLVKLIESAVDPNSWDAVGGSGVLEAVEPWGLLVISQTEEVHEEITALLQVARRAHQVAPAVPAPAQGATLLPAPLPPGVLASVSPVPAASWTPALPPPARVFPAMPMSMPYPGGNALMLKLYSVPEFDIEQVTRAIQGTVAPETWGPGPNQGAIFPVGYRMLIRQAPAVHAEIEELLDALRAANASGGYGATGGGMGGFF
jgi:hypothetical protein